MSDTVCGCVAADCTVCRTRHSVLTSTTALCDVARGTSVELLLACPYLMHFYSEVLAAAVAQGMPPSTKS